MSHEYFDGADARDFDLEIGAVYGLRAWTYRGSYQHPLCPRHVNTHMPWKEGVNIALCGADPGNLTTLKDPAGRGRKAISGITWNRWGRTIYEIMWSDGSMEQHLADTLTFETIPTHLPPLQECACGFYAYHSPEYWLGNTSWPVRWKSQSLIMGAIRGTGRTLIGTKGFRCQRAEIVGLVRPSNGDVYSSDTDDHLRVAYPGVPLFESPDALVAAIPLEKDVDSAAGRVEGT